MIGIAILGVTSMYCLHLAADHLGKLLGTWLSDRRQRRIEQRTHGF